MCLPFQCKFSAKATFEKELSDFQKVLSYNRRLHDLKMQLSQGLVLCVVKGAFFWDYSGIGILGISGICVLLGAILFSE